MLWFVAEVSDQNFIDEESKGEKANRICSSKKMKTEKPDSSSHDDQVTCTHHHKQFSFVRVKE